MPNAILRALQTGGGSIWDPGDGGQAESEVTWVRERAAASTAHQELAGTRPERQEQQSVHWPRALHGPTQDLPTSAARRLLLRRWPLANARETFNTRDCSCTVLFRKLLGLLFVCLFVSCTRVIFLKSAATSSLSTFSAQLSHSHTFSAFCQHQSSVGSTCPHNLCLPRF